MIINKSFFTNVNNFQNIRDELMTEDYRTMTLASIAKKYNITYQYVHIRIKKYIKQKGLNYDAIVSERRRHPKVIYIYWSDKKLRERRKKIIRAYYRGLSVKKISSIYKITPTSIYKILHQNGLNYREKRE